MNTKLRDGAMIAGMVVAWSIFYAVSKHMVDATGSPFAAGFLLRMGALAFLTVQLVADGHFRALFHQGRAAVILVIIGTYLVLVAGSVLLCRILQKNKRYYYRTDHFVSVASMAYRMKRNGAGLASICILLTMILVMLSSTSALYTGSEDCLNARYPNEICAFACKYGYDESLVTMGEKLDRDLKQAAEEQGAAITNNRTYY
jgi:hypothetical protein